MFLRVASMRITFVLEAILTAMSNRGVFRFSGWCSVTLELSLPTCACVVETQGTEYEVDPHVCMELYKSASA